MRTVMFHLMDVAWQCDTANLAMYALAAESSAGNPLQCTATMKECL